MLLWYCYQHSRLLELLSSYQPRNRSKNSSNIAVFRITQTMVSAVSLPQSLSSSARLLLLAAGQWQYCCVRSEVRKVDGTDAGGCFSSSTSSATTAASFSYYSILQHSALFSISGGWTEPSPSILHAGDADTG